MLEFKVIENLKPNKDLTNILKNFKYKVILGQIKTILHTNLQVIIPTEYKITYPTTLTILEYKVNEFCNPPWLNAFSNKLLNVIYSSKFHIPRWPFALIGLSSISIFFKIQAYLSLA